MGYTTLTYQKMSVNILNLRQSYSIHLKRYSISDSPEQDLTTLMANINEHVSQCSTDRLTQRDVFVQLVTELRPYNGTGDPKEKANATLFLLGALIHRYLRLQESYKTYNQSALNPLSFFGKKVFKVQDCGLYRAIINALQLDKKALDDLTIVTALEVFRDNMFLEIELPEKVIKDKIEKIKKPRYTTYPHFAQDVNFETHLNELIAHYKDRAKVFSKEFEAISLMQSLVMEVNKIQFPFITRISEWCHALKTAHPDSRTLTQSLLEDHLNEYLTSISKPEIAEELEEIKVYIQKLIIDGYRTKEFEVIESYPALENQLINNSTIEARMMILGGYLLLLNGGRLKQELTLILERSLSEEVEGPSDAEQKKCIDLLINYINDQNPELNYRFFNSKTNMLSELSRISIELARKIKPEREVISKPVVSLSP